MSLAESQKHYLKQLIISSNIIMSELRPPHSIHYDAQIASNLEHRRFAKASDFWENCVAERRQAPSADAEPSSSYTAEVSQQLHALAILLGISGEFRQAAQLVEAINENMDSKMKALPQSFHEPILSEGSLSNDQARLYARLSPSTVIPSAKTHRPSKHTDNKMGSGCSQCLALQTRELRELHDEWKQEYQIRRQMLIERAKVRQRSIYPGMDRGPAEYFCPAIQSKCMLLYAQRACVQAFHNLMLLDGKDKGAL